MAHELQEDIFIIFPIINVTIWHKTDEAAVETLKTWTSKIVLSYNQSCLDGGPNEASKHVNIENGLEEAKKTEKPNEIEIQKAQE